MGNIFFIILFLALYNNFTAIKFRKFSDASVIYRIIKKSRSSKKISNIYNLWKLNKTYNKLSFIQNLSSLLFISLNSLKKYGLK